MRIDMAFSVLWASELVAGLFQGHWDSHCSFQLVRQYPMEQAPCKSWASAGCCNIPLWPCGRCLQQSSDSPPVPLRMSGVYPPGMKSLQLEPTARTVTGDTTALMCWLWSHTLLVVIMASLVRADVVSRCMRWCGVLSLQKTSFSYLEPKTRKWNYKREVDLPAGEVPIGRLIPALLWRWLWSFGKGLWESHNPKMWVLFSWWWHGLHL